jgi:hypothetical protein
MEDFHWQNGCITGFILAILLSMVVIIILIEIGVIIIL